MSVEAKIVQTNKLSQQLSLRLERWKSKQKQLQSRAGDASTGEVRPAYSSLARDSEARGSVAAS